ncbi:hypothetical protein SBA5_360046 [Candidatus Sulfotelmatomonas gaucii]|uniref:Uncharacterized protein n=1 Tax=Candidatus Sulfuritelmatomonas gaucii TaxID=2043161 RepID=A0A2N9LHR1_9BACT|nr:hypothetical protein SBA5_360046 [Candidatus Sulfotelmatomonas gaucii]
MVTSVQLLLKLSKGIFIHVFIAGFGIE